jgi:hypothetical protein
MKKLWPLVIAIQFVCMTATAAIRPHQTPNQGQSPNQDPPVTLLNNRDILIMVDAGLDSEVVIKVIKASRCTFDTFPPVIRDLKRRGIPEAVLKAMVGAPYGPPADSQKISSTTQRIVHSVEQLKPFLAGSPEAGSAAAFPRQSVSFSGKGN